MNPGDLYELGSDVPELRRPVLLSSLAGFVDAGGAGRLVREQILDDLDSQVVARFDVDRLIDYRSRRPPMTYVEDHWESYEAPELTLRVAHDNAGTPFLVLTGPEPYHEWERFTAAVCELVERFGVRLTVTFHGIPMAVPHTRPIGLTAHATRAELVEGYQRFWSRVQVPGSAEALLEYKLGQAARDAIGFAVHVPNYLAQASWPAAALAAVDAIRSATGLDLPIGELRTAAEQADAEVAREVDGSDEVAGIVRALEEQYDSFLASREQGDMSDADIPSADELAAQFERFLADRDGGRDTGEG